MNTKITLLLLFLLEGTRAETKEEVIQDLNSQIAAVRTTVDEAIHNGGALIGQTHKTIGQGITQAETTIQNQIDQLNGIVQEAELEASEKGIDLSECTKIVDDLAVDVNTFEKCGTNQELNLLRMKLRYLGIVKRNVSSSISTCLRKSPDNLEDLKSCVLSDINLARQQIDNIQTQIGVVCENAVAGVTLCVEPLIKELDETINTAAHDFKNCYLNII